MILSGELFMEKEEDWGPKIAKGSNGRKGNKSNWEECVEGVEAGEGFDVGVSVCVGRCRKDFQMGERCWPF